MGRVTLIKIGAALAMLALWLGNQAGAHFPADPATATELVRQIYDGGTVVTYIGAIAVAISTVVLIVVYALKNTSQDPSFVFSSSRETLCTMAVFVGAAYVFGAFARPLGSADYPWPFVHGHEWQWQQFDLGWIIVGGIILAPVVLLFLTLLRELVARLAGRYVASTSGSAALMTMSEQLAGLKTVTDAILKTASGTQTDLSEHRTADVEALHAKFAKLGETLERMLGLIQTGFREIRNADLRDIRSEIAALREPVSVRASDTPETRPLSSPAIELTGREIGTEVLLHVKGVGDRRFTEGWAGYVGGRKPIEALSIRARDELDSSALEFRVFAQEGRATAWVSNGNYAGTRGRDLPLIGFAVRLASEFRDRFDVVYEASFFEGGVIGPCRNGEVCTSRIANDLLEAVHVTIVERGRAPAASLPAVVEKPEPVPQAA